MDLLPYGKQRGEKDPCPKCECTGVGGPSYGAAVKSPTDKVTAEFLEWRCNKCGYIERTKCRDSK